MAAHVYIVIKAEGGSTKYIETLTLLKMCF